MKYIYQFHSYHQYHCISDFHQMKNLWLKIILWIYAIFPVVGLMIAFIVSELELDKSLLGGILVGATYGFWVLFILYKVTSVSCPKCSSVILPLTKIFFSWEFLRKKCRNCGYDLRGRDSDSQHRS